MLKRKWWRSVAGWTGKLLPVERGATVRAERVHFDRVVALVAGEGRALKEGEGGVGVHHSHKPDPPRDAATHPGSTQSNIRRTWLIRALRIPPFCTDHPQRMRVSGVAAQPWVVPTAS
jgi:hypothetical protein